LDKTDVADIVVVGSGGAGLRASIEAADSGASTLLVSNGKIGKSGATMIAGADITLDGKGAAEIGLAGNEQDSKERFFNDILVQGYHLNNQKLVEAYVRDAPARTKELIDWGMPYIWDGKRAVISEGTNISRILVDQVKKRNITLLEDLYLTDLLTDGGCVTGVLGVDINSGKMVVVKSKAVVIATGGWQRAYSFTSAPGGLVGGMHSAAFRAGAELVNMEMVTFCPNVTLWPPALRGDIFPYILIEMFGELLDKRARPFLRDEYDPLIYKIATTTEWNKLIFSMAATRIVERGDGSPNGGTYYSIKNVPLNVVAEAEKVYPGWRWIRTNFTDLMNWLKEGNAVEVAPAAHYMEGGIRVDEYGATTVKGLYAAGECSGGLFGANRVASAITQILVQGAIAGRAAAQHSHKTELKNVNKDQVMHIENRLLRPFQNKDGSSPIGMKKRIQEVADKYLWVIRTGKGLKRAVTELQSISQHDVPKITIQTKSRAYNKEWLDAIEIESMLLTLQISAMSALMRTESRGVHNRSDYPQTDNTRWLKEIVAKQHNGKISLRAGPVTVTKAKLPRGKYTFEEGILRAVEALGE